MSEVSQTINILAVYADADKAWRLELESRLQAVPDENLAVVWHDRLIATDADPQAVAKPESADIILLFLSPDFLASEYLRSTEWQRALELHARRLVNVIPILFRACAWETCLPDEIHCLPENKVAVADPENPQEALDIILHELRATIESISSFVVLLEENEAPAGVAQVQSDNRVSKTELLEEYAQTLIERTLYPGRTGTRYEREMAVTPSLTQVFVPLQARRDIPDVDRRVLYAEVDLNDRLSAEKSEEKKRQIEREKWERQFRSDKLSDSDQSAGESLSDILKSQAKVVLLGDPGSGKTTQLSYLSYRMAEAISQNPERMAAALEKTDSLNGWEQGEYGPVRLPILIRIAGFAEARKNNPGLQLPDYISRFLAESLDMPEMVEPAMQMLREGLCYVLLDGLDEVIRFEDRQGIAEAINGFAGGPDYGKNRFLVASRIAGYRPGVLTGEFEQYTICSLNDDQIHEFLDKWCLAVEGRINQASGPAQIERAAQARVESFLTGMRKSPGVGRLASNPLLLRVLAMIHREKGDLPRHRVEIYESAAFTLLRDWNKSRSDSQPPVTERETLALLSPLAFYIHTNNQSQLLTLENTERKLREVLETDRDNFPADINHEEYIRTFLKWVREYTGLFVERGEGLYGFMHLTFEEYFTARHITTMAGENLQEVITRLHNPRWRVPILLAVGHIDQHFPARISGLIRQILRAGSRYEDVLCRDLLVAAACAAESANIEEALLEEITRELFSVYCGQRQAGAYRQVRKQVRHALLALKQGQNERGVAITEKILAERLRDHSRRKALRQALEMADWLNPQSDEVAEALAGCIHMGSLPRELWNRMRARSLNETMSDSALNWEDQNSQSMNLLVGGLWLSGWREAMEVSLGLSDMTVANMSKIALRVYMRDCYQKCKKLLAVVTSDDPEDLETELEAGAEEGGIPPKLLREFRQSVSRMEKVAGDEPGLKILRQFSHELLLLLDFGLSARYLAHGIEKLAKLLVPGEDLAHSEEERIFTECGAQILQNALKNKVLIPYFQKVAAGLEPFLQITDESEPVVWREVMIHAQEKLAGDLQQILSSAENYETYFAAALFLALIGNPDISGQVVDQALAAVSHLSGQSIDEMDHNAAWAMQLLTDELFHAQVNLTTSQHQTLTEWLRGDTHLAGLAVDIFLAMRGLTADQLQWCWSVLRDTDSPVCDDMLGKLESLTEIPGTAPYLSLLQTGLADERLRPSAMELARHVQWAGAETLSGALQWVSSENEDERNIAGLWLAQPGDPSELPRRVLINAAEIRAKPIASFSFAAVDEDVRLPELSAQFASIWDVVEQTPDDAAWFRSLFYMTSRSEHEIAVTEELLTGLQSASATRRETALALFFERIRYFKNTTITQVMDHLISANGEPEEMLFFLGAALQPDSTPRALFDWLRSLSAPDNQHSTAQWLRANLARWGLGPDAPLHRFAEKLENEDESLRLAAALVLLAADLQRITVRALIAALSASDDRIRSRATGRLHAVCRLLTSDGATEAVGELFQAYGEAQKGPAGTRLVTAMSNVPHRHPYWIRKWVDLLCDGAEDEVNRATEALVAWLNLDRESIYFLCRTLTDIRQPVAVRRVIAKGLGSAINKHDWLRSHEYIVAALMACLRDEDPQMRQTGAFALQWVAESADFRALKALLDRAESDSDINTRYISLRSAGNLLRRHPTIPAELISLVESLLDSPIRTAAACALAGYYINPANRPAEMNRPTALRHQLQDDREVLQAMVDVLCDKDQSWGTRKAEIDEIVRWLRQQDQESKPLIHMLLVQLAEEEKLMAGTGSMDDYRSFYSGWPTRQVLMAALAEYSDQQTFYDLIPDLSINEKDPQKRYEGMKPTIALFTSLAGDPGSWSSRQYAIRAIGNLQQFDANVAKAFFEACRDVMDVRTEAQKVAVRFNFFDKDSLSILTTAVRNDSVITASAAARILGQIGLHRSDEISAQREALADELAAMLSEPGAARIIYDSSDDAEAARLGPLYDEIHETLEKLTLGEDAGQGFGEISEEENDRKEAPARWEPTDIQGYSDLTGWNLDRKKRHLETIREKYLEYANTTGSAKKWWDAFENENMGKLDLVIALSEALQMRSATITEFFLAYVYSNTENINANLHYLDFVRVSKKVQKIKDQSNFAAGQGEEPWLYTDFPAVAIGGHDESPESDHQAFHSLLERIKPELNWDATDLASETDLQQWWETLEKRYTKRALVWLLEELKGRNTRIADFYEACLLSNCDNLQANLHYLTYLDLKAMERRYKGEVVVAGLSRTELNIRTTGEVVAIRAGLFRKALAEARERREQVSETVSDPPVSVDDDVLAANSDSDILVIDAADPDSLFRRCESCRSLIPGISVKCQMCGALRDRSANPPASEDLPRPGPEDEAGFSREVDRWCFGITDYPGEIYDEIVNIALHEGLASAFDQSLRKGIIFDILDIANRLSKAAKYLMDERDITLEILKTLPAPDSLSEAETFILAQLVDQVEQAYGGAIDIVETTAVFNCVQPGNRSV